MLSRATSAARFWGERPNLHPARPGASERAFVPRLGCAAAQGVLVALVVQVVLVVLLVLVVPVAPVVLVVLVVRVVLEY